MTLAWPDTPAPDVDGRDVLAALDLNMLPALRHTAARADRRAALLVDAGRSVAVERLIARVWGDDPPPQARRTLHTHVARIRRLLGDAVPLVRQVGAYRLDVDPADVDLHRFRALAEQARDVDRTAGEQAELWREALGLWRGEALAGLAGDWAARTREQLALDRAEAEVAWADAQIRRGRADKAVGPLSRLAGEHPLMEPAGAALIRALAATGRTAEALESYERIRRRLADELGADPGPELRGLHLDLLNPPQAAAPAQLPAAVRGFVGRGEQIARLDEILAGAAGTIVVVLSGMPGAGKSALAVHWAHRVRSRFPDGQMFVALRGFHPTEPPVGPADALATVLTSLGVRATGIPAGLDERAALYRGLLADRRMLVLLDDAVAAEQIRPLLPGGPACVVLVTSRNALSGLVAAEGAHPLPVEPLPVVDAVALLAGRLGDRRVAAVHRGADRPAAIGRPVRAGQHLGQPRLHQRRPGPAGRGDRLLRAIRGARPRAGRPAHRGGHPDPVGRGLPGRGPARPGRSSHPPGARTAAHDGPTGGGTPRRAAMSRGRPRRGTPARRWPSDLLGSTS